MNARTRHRPSAIFISRLSLPTASQRCLSLPATASRVRELPPVKLDTTLTDLFKLSSPRNAHKRTAYIHALVPSSVDLGPLVGRNSKYLYQDPAFITTAAAAAAHPQNQLDTTRALLAVKYLHVLPQRDAFITGGSNDAAAIFFHGRSTDDAEIAHDRRQAEITLGVLGAARQRPRVLQVPGPSSIALAASGLDLIAGYKVAHDDLCKHPSYPLIVPPDKHWFLNSKGALAFSGLPTPRTEVIAVSGGYPIPAEACCEACRATGISHDPGSAQTPLQIPAGCSGQRAAWLREQEARIVSAVAARQGPFVFKTQQTMGGGGTWIVRSGAEKRALLGSFTRDDGVVRRLLPLLNESNCHLQPGSVLISDFVEEPVGNYGCTFFVTDSGGVIFMGVSEQVLAGDGKTWIGGAINYPNQKMLQGKLQQLMDQTAKWLHGEHGYYGPVGMDVLETKVHENIDGRAEAKTTMLIVDLNVRTTGSMSLPLFNGHFTSRGLSCAGTCTFTTDQSRAAFIEHWKEEFLSGTMVILSWYESHALKSSMGAVIVGAVDARSLEGLISKLGESTRELSV